MSEIDPGGDGLQLADTFLEIGDLNARSGARRRTGRAHLMVGGRLLLLGWSQPRQPESAAATSIASPASAAEAMVR